MYNLAGVFGDFWGLALTVVGRVKLKVVPTPSLELSSLILPPMPSTMSLEM